MIMLLPVVLRCCAAVGRVVLELFRYKKGSTLEEHAPLVSWGGGGGRGLCAAGLAAVAAAWLCLPAALQRCA